MIKGSIMSEEVPMVQTCSAFLTARSLRMKCCTWFSPTQVVLPYPLGTDWGVLESLPGLLGWTPELIACLHHLQLVTFPVTLPLSSSVSSSVKRR